MVESENILLPEPFLTKFGLSDFEGDLRYQETEAFGETGGVSHYKSKSIRFTHRATTRVTTDGGSTIVTAIASGPSGSVSGSATKDGTFADVGTFSDVTTGVTTEASDNRTIAFCHGTVYVTASSGTLGDGTA